MRLIPFLLGRKAEGLSLVATITTKGRFPKRRDDGSFCVEVALRFTAQQPDALVKMVNEWIVEWVSINRY